MSRAKVEDQVGQALQAVLYLEAEAARFDVDDPRAELLWQAANLLRQLHGLGDGEYMN